MVFAVAHVRGGGEMGRHWYENGKTLTKKNTFTDFVSCAQHLIDTGRHRADRMVADGGSAGGLLMGAVANLAPELFAGILANVPFVDPLTSILDPSLPLTVIEWDEWGNPLADKDVYEYMQLVQPVRERRGQGLPGHPRDHQHQRHPGALRRTGQVGRQTARHQDRRLRRCCSRPR